MICRSVSHLVNVPRSPDHKRCFCRVSCNPTSFTKHTLDVIGPYRIDVVIDKIVLRDDAHIIIFFFLFSTQAGIHWFFCHMAD